MSTAAHSTAQAKPPRTTAAWDTRTIVVMGLLASIGVLLSFVEIGNFFGFMEYDASNVPAIVGGVLLGPVPGVVIGVVTCAVHALLMGDFWGGLMNAAAVTVFVLVSSGIYWRERDTKHAVLGLSAATLVNVPAMVCLGLAVTPIYTGWPVEQVIGMLLPVVVPFNLGKGAANAVLAFALLKPTESALSSKR